MRCWNDVVAAAEARKPIRSALGSGRLVQRRGRILIDTPCGDRPELGGHPAAGGRGAPSSALIGENGPAHRENR